MHLATCSAPTQFGIQSRSAFSSAHSASSLAWDRGGASRSWSGFGASAKGGHLARSCGDIFPIASGVQPNKARPKASSAEGGAGVTPLGALAGGICGGATRGGTKAGREGAEGASGACGCARNSGRKNNSNSRARSCCLVGTRRKWANSRMNRSWRRRAAVAVAARSCVLVNQPHTKCEEPRNCAAPAEIPPRVPS